MVVNVATGNTDAHAKNYGVFHRQPGRISVTPMYDVVPALFLNPTMFEMGLRVDDVLRIDRVSREHITREGRAWGLPLAAVQQEIDDTLNGLRAGIEAACARFPDSPPALHARVTRGVNALAV